MTNTALEGKSSLLYCRAVASCLALMGAVVLAAAEPRVPAPQMADAMPTDAVGRRLIMLDNWNEWCEGHYIAPHRSGGFKYLQAVREVFTKRDNLPDYRLPHDLGLGPYDKRIDWNAPEVKWDEP